MNRGVIILCALLAAACGSNGGDNTVLDSGTGQDTSLDNKQPPVDSGNKDTGSSNDAKSDAPATGCGTCPTGYACGTANGIAVCRSTTSTIPLFTNVYVIMMENTSLTTLQTGINGGQAPNLKGWQKTTAASSSAYHGVSHPSLPNYVALTSGDTQGIGCDCGAAPNNGSCSPIGDVCFATCSCDVATTVSHLGDQLEAASKTWMDFGEDMGATTPCNLADSGNYAVRHNPFLYYDNVQTPATRCKAHVVDFSSFSAASPAAFNFIVPNLVNDMHGGSIPAGDTWLGTHANDILNSSAYKAGGLLIIVWDEDDSSGGFFPPYTDDPVGMFVFSPYAKSGGFVSTVKADHYAMLATFEDGLALPRLGKAATATPLTDFFPAN